MRDVLYNPVVMNNIGLGMIVLLLMAAFGWWVYVLKRQNVELASRNRSMQVLSSTLKLQDLLGKILTELQQVVPCDSASVFHIKGEYFELVGGVGFPNLEELLEVRFGIYDQNFPNSVVAQTRAPHIVADAPQQYPHFNDEKHAKANIRGWMGIPLIFGNELIGMLALDKREPGYFKESHADKVLSFASQAAIALQNAKLYEEVHRRADETELLYKIGLQVSSNLSLDQTLHELFEHCRQLLRPDVFYVAIYDEESYIIQHPLFYDRGEFKDVLPRDIREIPGLSGQVILEKKTLYIPETLDPQAAARYQIIRLGGTPSQSYLGVPMVANGRTVGAISMQSYEPHAYSLEQIRLLETIATQAAFAIQNSHLFDKAQKEIISRIEAEESLREANRRLEIQIREISNLRDQLREQAIRDPLTSLFNRRYLTETLERELDQARRANTPISIIIMDIDDFKTVNDTHGHDGGDKLLNALATLLNAHCRVGDIACRYGGEEFVVVLIGTALETARQRAEELRVAFHALIIPCETGRMSATLSLGVASYPRHGETGEAVLIKADQALYQAKQMGRNRVVIAP